MAEIYKPFSEFKYWFVRENEETVDVFRASDKKKIGFMTIEPSDVDAIMTKDNKWFLSYHEAVSDGISEEVVCSLRTEKKLKIESGEFRRFSGHQGFRMEKDETQREGVRESIFVFKIRQPSDSALQLCRRIPLRPDVTARILWDAAIDELPGRFRTWIQIPR